MNDLNLQLVREFFELNLFRVMPFWQRSERDPHFFIENALAGSNREAAFELATGDLSAIDRAAVGVRAWHADRFYASVVEANPIVSAFAHRETSGAARAVFGAAEYRRILVVSELPVSSEPRAAATKALAGMGVDHVVEFPTILEDLVQRVGVNGTYISSSSLQLIQLFKRYRFFQQQQLELGFPMEPERVERNEDVVEMPGEDDPDAYME